MNLQVLNFRKCGLAFLCPVTKLTCPARIVTRTHPLQVVVPLSTLLFSTAQSTVARYLYFKPRMSGSCRDIAGAAKKCQEIAVDTKVKIIELEWGEKMVDISHTCNTNHATISMILRIMEMWTLQCQKISTVILKKHGETSQCVWVQHRHQHQVLLSLMLIQ